MSVSYYAIKQEMAVFSIFSTCNTSRLPSNFLSSLHFLTSFHVSSDWRNRRRSKFLGKVQVVSSHSNPKILKSNRRSRYGQSISPYDSEEEEEDGGETDADEDDDWFSDVGFYFSVISCLKIFSFGLILLHLVLVCLCFAHWLLNRLKQDWIMSLI